MKVSYIVALLMIVLMIGCATKEEAAPVAPVEPTVPAEEPPAAPTQPVEEVAAEEKVPVVVGDIVVTSAGFDPAEMTVTVGSMLTIKSSEGRHKLTVDGTTTDVIEEGAAVDVTFDEVGKIRVFDIFTKKSAYVTVTEEAAEEAGEAAE